MNQNIFFFFSYFLSSNRDFGNGSKCWRICCAGAKHRRPAHVVADLVSAWCTERSERAVRRIYSRSLPPLSPLSVLLPVRAPRPLNHTGGGVMSGGRNSLCNLCARARSSPRTFPRPRDIRARRRLRAWRRCVCVFVAHLLPHLSPSPL